MNKTLRNLTVGLALLTAGTSFAYDDWHDMEFGVPLAYTTAWSPFGGRFTLESDQTVELKTESFNTYGMADGFELFQNSSLTGNVLLNTDNNSGDGSYSLSAGTYYYYCPSVWGAGQITVSLSEGVKLGINEILPAEGSTFGASVNDGFLSLHCDFNVLVQSWQVKSSAYTSEVIPLSAATQGMVKAISIYVKDVLKDLQAHGLSEGDDFQIVLRGIQDPSGNLYGEDGTLTLSYKVGAPAIDLVSSSLNADEKNLLLSYYAPGDETALVTFTFSGKFDAEAPQTVTQLTSSTETDMTLYGPILELSCACTSSAQKLYYQGTFSEDCKTATFDISGFDFGSWGGALGVDGAEPGFKVFNIKDMEGNKALGSGESTPGAYTFSADYRKYSKASFKAQWTPQAGDLLKETTTVKITTVLDASDATGVTDRIKGFECVAFVAKKGPSASVPYSDCSVTYDSGTVTISCPTPEEVLNVDNVTVTVKGIIMGDGLSYASDLISADFNPVMTDASSFVKFKTTGYDNETSDSDEIQTLTSILLFTELDYEGEIPTLTCSDESVTREVWYVNPTPSTDAEGNHYYVINVGNPISIESGNGASVVSPGTTFTISFPAKSFFSEDSTEIFSPVNHTWTFVEGIPSTGLDTLFADGAAPCNVYTLDGILVLRSASSEDVKALPAGRYVVASEGKSIVISLR